MSTRDCPYCNTKMKIGYQYNLIQPIQWIPVDRKHARLRGELIKMELEQKKVTGLKDLMLNISTVKTAR